MYDEHSRRVVAAVVNYLAGDGIVDEVCAQVMAALMFDQTDLEAMRILTGHIVRITKLREDDAACWSELYPGAPGESSDLYDLVHDLFNRDEFLQPIVDRNHLANIVDIFEHPPTDVVGDALAWRLIELTTDYLKEHKLAGEVELELAKIGEAELEVKVISEIANDRWLVTDAQSQLFAWWGNSFRSLSPGDAALRSGMTIAIPLSDFTEGSARAVTYEHLQDWF